MTDAADEAQGTLTVVPGKTDRELAEDFRIRTRVLLDMVCGVMNDANAAGLEIGWTITRNPMLGKNVVHEIVIKRPL